MPDKKAERPEGQMRRRPMRRRKKVCAFCADANKALDYKDVALLKKYVSERGKILPRRITVTVLSTREHLQLQLRELDM